MHPASKNINQNSENVFVNLKLLVLPKYLKTKSHTVTSDFISLKPYIFPLSDTKTLKRKFSKCLKIYPGDKKCKSGKHSSHSEILFAVCEQTGKLVVFPKVGLHKSFSGLPEILVVVFYRNRSEPHLTRLENTTVYGCTTLIFCISYFLSPLTNLEEVYKNRTDEIL